METEFSRPATGRTLAEVTAFLSELGLDWDAGVEFTVVLREGDAIAATGSRQGNVIKCVGVSRTHQGEGLAATLVTELVKDAFAHGLHHLFIFTTPKSAAMFRELGFYTVAETRDAALLENARDGVARFVAGLAKPAMPGGRVAAIVANANPFTLGHRYLVETAAAGCDVLHLFVLSEDRSRFSAAMRLAMVKAGTADLKNVLVHPTGDYLVSTATFPEYFIKDKARADEINCTLDLTVFADRFARPLAITRRYVGTEPTDPVTLSYNEQMKAMLPRFGVEVVEIPRLERDGRAVSASVVRALMDSGRWEEVERIVPPTTYAALRKMVAPPA